MRAVKRFPLVALTLTSAITCSVLPAMASGVEALPTQTPAKSVNALRPRDELPAASKQPIAVIWIARIKVKSPVYRGVTMDIFKKGVGWYPGTALPGKPGNVVFGGHRVTWPEPFRHIDAIKIGDPILVNYLGKRYTYTVKTKRIVRPTGTWILDQNVAQPTLTLFACHPVGRTSHRYVVIASLKA